MTHMRHFRKIVLAATALSLLPGFVSAQSNTGSIDLSARITPTGARPEPVRQFSFYILTKSYTEIVNEAAAKDVLPSRDQFIDGLKCSTELKTWLKAHDSLDLTSPELDKLLTTDDIMKVPEFFAAYQRSNAGGVTKGLPTPKYRDTDKEANPDKYQKQKEEFLTATRKFIETHPATVQGIELELTGISPKFAWDTLHVEHKRKIAQLAPDTAQVKYLAGKADTDLDGHALVTGLAPGNYWVSTLGMEATSGDKRLTWDVPVAVRAGLPTRIELSNINAAQ
jgi:hypothetical protein